jgi:hypothetical protein
MVLSDTSQIQKELHSYSCTSARQALAIARAVHASLIAEADCASKQIDEMEEFLGML